MRFTASPSKLATLSTRIFRDTRTASVGWMLSVMVSAFNALAATLHQNLIDHNQRRSLNAGAAMRPHRDLHVLPKRDQEPHEILHRECLKIAAQQLRYLRRRHTKQTGGFGLLKTPGAQQTIDFQHKFRFSKMLPGIWQASVGKDIAAAQLMLDVCSHDLRPFASVSASRRRLSINLISGSGVARPDFDFF